jgi:hypothetical protein
VALPLSISIVCCNNEQTLPRVLASIHGLASELIALDSGSTDGTIHLLREAGATVIHQPWLGFVRQKQAALDRCTQPWILHLDSDESVEPDLRRSIEEALQKNDSAASGYEVNRKVWYAGAFLRHAWQPEWRLRLVRQGRARWTGHDPHDAMELLPGHESSTTHRLAGDLRHDSMGDGICAFLRKQADHARVAAAAQRLRSRRGSVARLTFSPLAEFAKQMVLRSAWRDGWRGWVAASASSLATAMKHAALLEASHAPAFFDQGTTPPPRGPEAS